MRCLRECGKLEMHTYGEFSGGPGSGVYVSRDGGTKWTRIEEHGMPQSPLGKIDVAVAPTNSSRVLRADSNGGPRIAVAIGRRRRKLEGSQLPARVDRTRRLLHSDCGFHWKRQRSAGGEQLVPPVPGWRRELSKRCRWGGDTHDIWIDPTNPDRFVITDDGGMNITTVHGRGFHRVQLPIGQMYHVAVDNQIPYYFYSNMQDDGNMRGPSVPDRRSQETGWDHAHGRVRIGIHGS